MKALASTHYVRALSLRALIAAIGKRASEDHDMFTELMVVCDPDNEAKIRFIADKEKNLKSLSSMLHKMP